MNCTNKDPSLLDPMDRTFCTVNGPCEQCPRYTEDDDDDCQGKDK